MKKILFALLTVFALTSLSSCQKDDDDGGGSGDIVGTSWRGLVDEETWNGVIYNDYCTLTFASNNKVTSKIESYENGVLDPGETEIFHGTYQYKGSSGSITATDEDGEKMTFNFSISGNNLTIFDWAAFDSGGTIVLKKM